MIRLHDVTFSLAHGGGRVAILKGVTFHLSPGTVAGLVGPSGSGKSSLLALIAGVERPTGGSVVVAEQPLHQLDEERLARFRRERVGVVYQDFHLIPAMTAVDNVALPLELAGRSHAREKAVEMLAAVGLSQRLDHRPAELSGGEQQRVAIARAFVGRPPLILADEPTGNLDQNTSRQIMDLLFALVAEWGSTMLLVTHDRALARRTGTLLQMVDGQVRPGEGVTSGEGAS